MKRKPVLKSKDRIIVRKAMKSDSFEVLDWRNDHVARDASLNSHVIQKADHDRWFSSAISKKRHLCLIGEHNADKIGIVNFEQFQSKHWQVSINLNPEYRGLGFGALLLRNAGINLIKINGLPCIMHAVVKGKNYASKKIFERCGYTLKKIENGNYCYEYQCE